MSPNLSNRGRKLLLESLLLVEERRHEIIDRMEEHLGLTDPSQEPGQSEIGAIMVHLLIAQARCLSDTGSFEDLSRVVDEHSEFGISGQTYSRFGDALSPILKDVLGPCSPSAAPGIWVDLFWKLIQQARSAPTSQAA